MFDKVQVVKIERWTVNSRFFLFHFFFLNLVQHHRVFERFLFIVCWSSFFLDGVNSRLLSLSNVITADGAQMMLLSLVRNVHHSDSGLVKFLRMSHDSINQNSNFSITFKTHALR